jgi:hypothetical protein
MNETELLALYRETAALRKQLADAEIREMDLKDNISLALDYLVHNAWSIPQEHVDELTCLLNGE